MLRVLITILILLNISLGFIADASQNEAMHCSQSFSNSDALLDGSLPSTEGRAENHSGDQCVTSHCHFGHCATVKSSEPLKSLIAMSPTFEFNSNLSPTDFVFNLLRPPISI